MKLCLTCQSSFESPQWRCPSCGSRPEVRQGHVLFAPDLVDTNDGFDSSHFSSLCSVEEGHFWFRARARLIVSALNRHFPGASTLLEVGCGTGMVLSAIHRALPAVQLTGGDIFLEALTHTAARLVGATLLQMDARRIPFHAEFDLICACDVLEHVNDDELVLAQMFRAAKPGGGIILTVPQHPALWSPGDEYSRHVRRYTRRDLLAKVNGAGFELLERTSFVSLLFPLMFATRLAWRLVPSRTRPLGEFDIGRRANRCLEAVLAVERRLIEAGVSFPIGGSLLVVARRPAQDASPAPPHWTRVLASNQIPQGATW